MPEQKLNFETINIRDSRIQHFYCKDCDREVRSYTSFNIGAKLGEVIYYCTDCVQRLIERSLTPMTKTELK